MDMAVVDYDLCVIGGGINGVGIARDAAGRGLKVLLLEAGDLGGATSSASTKLIHGGLRYLEYFAFRLVRESLAERELLLLQAPHVIWPMEFVLLHTPEQRPAWMVKAGLFLYDNLAKREKLNKSGSLSLTMDARGLPIQEDYKKAFYYADCWADDSRLVVLNAMSAAQKGATILTRHQCTHLKHDDNCWAVSFENQNDSDDVQTIKASMVINAAGPWVRDVLDNSQISHEDKKLPQVKLVKGSHIIVKRQYDGEHAYIMQQPDRRIVFAIPYEHEYTLIGTTEEEFEGDPRHAMISEGEKAYLMQAYNRFFEKPISSEDILWTYSGVRPLYDEGDSNATSATRDYRLYAHLDYSAPMISVFGGKLTTYRKLAEAAVDKIMHLANRDLPPWTGHSDTQNILPGGNIYEGDFEAFLSAQGHRYQWLHEELLYRYCRSYGTCMDTFLQGAKSIEDLGLGFGFGIYEAEILYLLHYEFAQTAEDILWRRSKLGLHVHDDVAAKINTYIANHQKGQKI